MSGDALMVDKEPATVALAHDWLVGVRGGEMVLDRLARLVLDSWAPGRLYTMFDNGAAHTPAIDAFARRVSPLSRLPGRRWLLPAYPWAVGVLSRRLARDHAARPIDLLISTSSCAIKGLAAPAGVPHLCYCHSPARYMWHLSGEYGGALSPMGVALRVYGPMFRRWDRRVSARVTTLIANSSHTAGVIERCYGRRAQVLHPPVRAWFWTPGEPEGEVLREPFWLFAGALEPYKRADLAIKAANAAGHQLVVVGTGSMRRRLERMAGPTVRFMGRVGDAELRDLYRGARCLVFPQVEDFGIVAVEAQACGTPVVARRAGGALETVVEGQTGSFFDDASVDALLAAIERVPMDVEGCRSQAMRFSEEVFDAGARAHIEAALSQGA